MQVIGRNIRFLLVVIIAAYFSRVAKKHTHLRVASHKLITAIIITLGVLLFNFAKPLTHNREQHLDPSQEWKGYVLLIISVLCDALFSDFQAYSKGAFKPNATQLSTTINFWALIFTVIVASV